MLAAVQSGVSYLRSNPMYLLAAARNAARLQLSVPLDLVRWLIERRPRGKGPERIEVYAAPPNLGVSLTVDLYGTKIDVSAQIGVEGVENMAEALQIQLRVSDLQVQAPPGSPAAMMVQSLDLSRPGNLLNMMPKRHAVLVEARDDLFVLDLLRVQKLANNESLRRVLAVLADTVRVTQMTTEGDLLVVGFSANLLSLPAALTRLR